MEAKFWSQARTVWIFGDSYTEGAGLAFEDLLSMRLQKRLDETYGHGAWRVINLARAGSGVLLASRVYDRARLQKPPEVVIFSTPPANDFANAAADAREKFQRHPLVRKLRFPYSSSLAQRTLKIYRTELERMAEAPKDWIVAALRSFWSRFGRNEAIQRGEVVAASAAAEEFPYEDNDRFKRLSPAFQERARNFLVHLPFLKGVLTKPGAALQAGMGAPAKNVAVYREQLSSILEKIDGDKVPLTIMAMIPKSFQFTCEQCEQFREMGLQVAAEKLMGKTLPQKAMRNLWRELTATKEGSRYCLLDLLEVLAPLKHQQLYLPYDNHLGPAGHAAYADALFKIIRTADLKRSVAQPGVECGGAGAGTEIRVEARSGGGVQNRASAPGGSH